MPDLLDLPTELLVKIVGYVFADSVANSQLIATRPFAFKPFSFFRTSPILYKSTLLKEVAWRNVAVRFAKGHVFSLQRSNPETSRVLSGTQRRWDEPLPNLPMPTVWIKSIFLDVRCYLIGTFVPVDLARQFPSLEKITIQEQNRMQLRWDKNLAELGTSIADCRNARTPLKICPKEIYYRRQHMDDDSGSSRNDGQWFLDNFIEKGFLVIFEFCPCPSDFPSESCNHVLEFEDIPFSDRYELPGHVQLTCIKSTHDGFEKWQDKLSASSLRLKFNPGGWIIDVEAATQIHTPDVPAYQDFETKKWW